MRKYFLLFLTVLLVFSCEEEDMACDSATFDEDGDGVPCSLDCNDEDATVSKNQLYYLDNDGDGFGDKNDPGTLFCEGSAPSEYSINNTDCDDSNSEINPDADQGCDGVDNNCDGDSTAPQIITYTAPDRFCSVNVNCTAQVSIPFSISSICKQDAISIQLLVDLNSDGNNDQALDPSQLTGSFPNYEFAGDYPIGEHTLTIKTDNCGCDVVEEVIPFTVADCKAPTPICINGLSVELLPQAAGTDADGDGDPDAGANTIKATDFIASDITDCSLPIIYSINLIGDSLNINQQELILTCDNNSTTLVEIHAWDNVQNQDYCETYILIGKDNVACN